MTKLKPKKITTLAMFCAVAYVMMLLSGLIPINIGGFLSMDFKDIAIVICGFAMGPGAAAAVSAVVSFLEMLTVSTGGPVGFLMNVLSTWAFAIPTSLVYITFERGNRAVWGAALGTVSMTASMLLWNLLVTPGYLGIERAAVEGMLLTVFLPFNLIKGGLNALGVILVYKPVLRALAKE